MTNTIPWFDIDNLVFVGDDYTLFLLEEEVNVLFRDVMTICKSDIKVFKESINSVRYPYLVEVFKLS